MDMLTLTDVDALTGGIYTCVVTNAAGNDSDGTFIFIAPYFVIEPIGEKTANGSSVTLQCVAEAFPSPSYQWARTNGGAIREGIETMENSLLFNPVLFGDEGDYHCNATSRNAVSRSQDSTLAGKMIVIIGDNVKVRLWTMDLNNYGVRFGLDFRLSIVLIYVLEQ